MFENRVRCSYCESEFYEDYIITNGEDGQEICPVCKEEGCLMDIENEEEQQCQIICRFMN